MGKRIACCDEHGVSFYSDLYVFLFHLFIFFFLLENANLKTSYSAIFTMIYCQGSDLWKDKDRFKKFAQSSLELCKVYAEISVSTGSRRELLAAEMHLKNIIRQARYLVFEKN